MERQGGQPGAGAAATAGLPIVLGLQSEGEFPHTDLGSIGTFLEAEFRARREHYPNSPFVLLMRGGGAVSELGHRAAAACGIPVIDPPAGDLALFCHLLFDISGTAVAATSPASVVAESAAAAALAVGAGTALDSELLEFEEELKLEVIHLQVSADSGELRQQISRFGIEEPAQPQLVHPPPHNRLMKYTERFNLDARTQPGIPPLAGAHPSMHAIYACADALAMIFQRKIHLAFRVVCALAVSAAVLYGCFSTIAGSRVARQDHLILGYVLLILVSYGVFLYARNRDLHSRFIEYRALAEGLRVQHYWRACGIARSAAACYLIRQPINYQWIRLALWYLAATHPPAAGDRSPDAVLEGWIDDQLGYFTRSHARSVRLQSRLRFLVTAIFVCGLSASVLIPLEPHLSISAPYRPRISLISFVCPAVATAIVGLVTKLGLIYQANHYGRMQGVFDQARRRLRRCPTGATVPIAMALGEEALLESESWSQFRRERGMDEPSSPLRRPW